MNNETSEIVMQLKDNETEQLIGWLINITNSNHLMDGDEPFILISSRELTHLLNKE